MKVAISHKNYQNYLLTLFMLSGVLKVFLDYCDYPFNLTVQLLCLIIVDIFYNFLRERKIIFTQHELLFLAILLIFYLIAAISLIYTPSHDFGNKKFSYMMIPIVGFLYTKFIVSINLKILYNTLLYVLLPLVIWFILFKYLLWNNTSSLNFIINKNKFMPLRSEYLNFGYLMGIFALLSIKFSKKPLITISVSILLILGLASRGALIFLILSMILIYFRQIFSFVTNMKLKKKSVKTILYLAVPLVMLGFIFINKILLALNFGLARFSSLINIKTDTSALERLDQYFFVIQEGLTFQGFTIGYGLGSFGINYFGKDESAYPHNIFLETWHELGFLTMCLLIFFFVFSIKLKRPLLLKSLAFFAILTAMKSHSFAYDRNLFILFGLLIFYRKNIQIPKN